MQVVVSLPDISQLVVRTTDLPEEQLVTVVRHVLENMLNDGQRPIQLTESIQFSTKIEMILPATCSRLGSVYLPAAEVRTWFSSAG